MPRPNDQGTIIADVAAQTQLAAPAGGAGAAAGAYDTAANRDLAIASINAARADHAALRTTVNNLLAELRASGTIRG